MAAAATGRAYLGISPSAYQEACEVMGEDQAAIVIAAIDDHGVAAGKTREEEAGVVSLMHGLRLTDAVIFAARRPGFPGLGILLLVQMNAEPGWMTAFAIAAPRAPGRSN